MALIGLQTLSGLPHYIHYVRRKLDEDGELTPEVEADLREALVWAREAYRKRFGMEHDAPPTFTDEVSS